jgi:hypothetical protein
MLALPETLLHFSFFLYHFICVNKFLLICVEDFPVRPVTSLVLGRRGQNQHEKR